MLLRPLAASMLNTTSFLPKAAHAWCLFVLQITISGYGDVTPKSIPEMVVANVCMLSGVIISGLLISKWKERRKER